MVMQAGCWNLGGMSGYAVSMVVLHFPARLSGRGNQSKNKSGSSDLVFKSMTMTKSFRWNNFDSIFCPYSFKASLCRFSNDYLNKLFSICCFVCPL